MGRARLKPRRRRETHAGRWALYYLGRVLQVTGLLVTLVAATAFFGTPSTLAMLRMIRAYRDATGFKVGFKPAGGISTAKDILNYQILMKEELGREWLEPDLFRIGASSLLADIERQLEHHVTGRYSAFNRHAAG